MKRMIGELGEQPEKFGGKSERSTNHKSMEEVHYEENLELVGWSEDSGWSLSSEMLGDLEGKVLEGSKGEVKQEVVRVDLGDGSRSGSEPLERSVNIESLVGGDDMRNSMMMMKKG